jgi:hypothetical protein
MKEKEKKNQKEGRVCVCCRHRFSLVYTYSMRSGRTERKEKLYKKSFYLAQINPLDLFLSDFV